MFCCLFFFTSAIHSSSSSQYLYNIEYFKDLLCFGLENALQEYDAVHIEDLSNFYDC